MSRLWLPEESLEHARRKGVGAACALVRTDNTQWLTTELWRAFFNGGARRVDVMGGHYYHLYQRPDFWEEHDLAVLYLVEATQRVRSLTATDVFKKNAEMITDETKRRIVPVMMVSERSHTMKGYEEINPDGPNEVTQQALDLGVTVLHVENSNIRGQVVAALEGLLSGHYPKEFIRPSTAPLQSGNDRVPQPSLHENVPVLD